MSPLVKTIPRAEATGAAKRFYETVRLGPDGALPKLVEAWSLGAEVAESWLRYRDAAISASGLDQRQFEVLLCRVVYNLKCAYVARNHVWILFQQGHYTKDEIVQIVHDWQNAELDHRDKALLAFADRMCFESDRMGEHDVEALRNVGFDDARIVALAFLVGWLITDAVVPSAFGLGDGDHWTAEMQAVLDWRL